jgi:hypothetical protein
MDSGGSSYLTAQTAPYPSNLPYVSPRKSVTPPCVTEHEAQSRSPRLMSTATTEGEQGLSVPPLTAVPNDLNPQSRVAALTVSS